MVIHLSGRNADVFGDKTHENEAANEMKKGILKIFIFDFDFNRPTTPAGNKIAFITKNSTIRFTGL